MPVKHPFPRRVQVAGRDALAFVADAVHRDDPALLHEEPEHAGVELAHVAQLEQPLADGFGQRLPVILPVPQLRQTGDYRREVVRITGLQLVQELPHGARSRLCLIELYCEIHDFATSIVMYPDDAQCIPRLVGTPKGFDAAP